MMFKVAIAHPLTTEQLDNTANSVTTANIALPPMPKVFQFRLRSLLLFVGGSAVILGVGKFLGFDYVFPLVAIGIMGLMLFVNMLMSSIREGAVVVYESPVQADAHLARDLLAKNGIPALYIDGTDPYFLTAMAHRVTVDSAHVDAALECLKQLELPERTERDGANETEGPMEGDQAGPS